MAMGQKLSANGPKTSKPPISWCLMSIRAILGLCSTPKDAIYIFGSFGFREI